MTHDPTRRPAEDRRASDPFHRPYSTGSAASLAILPQLHRAPAGLLLDELVDATGLPASVVSQALQGLKDRGRVVSSARGPRSRWKCTHHATSAGKAGTASATPATAKAHP